MQTRFGNFTLGILLLLGFVLINGTSANDVFQEMQRTSHSAVDSVTTDSSLDMIPAPQKLKAKIDHIQNVIALQKKYDLIIDVIIVLTLFNILAIYFYFRTKRRDANFLRDIINALNYPLFVYSMENKKIKLANFSAEKDFYGRNTYSQIHQEHLAEAEKWLAKLVETHKPIIREIVQFGKHGNVKHYQIHLHPLFNRKGTIEYLVEYWVDVTIQKQAVERVMRSKEALKQSKEEFEKVINSIPDALYSALINKSGKIIDSYYSPVVEKITGYPPSFFDGDKNAWANIVHPEDLPKLRKRNAQAIIERQEETRNEYRIIHKNGEIRYIRSSVTFNYLENGLIRADGILMDVTEMKKAEIELMKVQKLESIGVLAGGIAHDFNNILTAILGNISLARLMGKENSKVEARLNEAEKACLRAKDLTQQLLTFSKGGAPVKKATSLGNLLKEAATFLLRGSNVKPQFDFSDSLWLAEADEGQLSQVINNLVINAKQAMPAGGILHIRAYNYYHDGHADLPLEKGRYVCFSVQDAGVGIEEKFLARIFDPYFTTKKTGSGLGLAVTYSIIKKHKGHIAVRSKLGEGTTFTVYLPALEKAAVVNDKQEKSVETLQGRVLLMDDEELILEVGSEMLASLGLSVTTAKDGEEAIRLYRQGLEKKTRFDVVVLDLTVPGGKGGQETLKELKQIDPRVKAIVSSGYSTDPIMAEFDKYGFAACVSKPYRIEEMADALRKILNHNSIENN